MMGSGSKPAMLARLRGQIDALEKRVMLGPMHGQSPFDGAGDGAIVGAPAGLLHEIWGDHFSHSAAMLGFALGQARGLLGGRRRAVLWLSIDHEAQETALVYGAGLRHFGFDPTRLLIGRMQQVPDLLWAVEEAIACPAIAAVIVDIGGMPKVLDFTVSRRLQLRADAGGASVFMMRYGAERMASAAAYRWHVQSYVSAMERFDAKAPGGAQWRVALEKGPRLNRGYGGIGQAGWILGWGENGFTRVTDAQADKAALSGAEPAALGHGLLETA
jgi:protein ImuA